MNIFIKVCAWVVIVFAALSIIALPNAKGSEGERVARACVILLQAIAAATLAGRVLDWW